jgi:hypothetical protein
MDAAAVARPDELQILQWCRDHLEPRGLAVAALDQVIVATASTEPEATTKLGVYAYTHVMNRQWICLLGLVLAAAALAGCAAEVPFARDGEPAAPVRLDVIFVATDLTIVNAMLTLAGVTRDDVVYDLGCGDGRIVIAAAREFGARGVGVDLDPQRIREAQANAVRAGVADRVTFRVEDVFDTDIRSATVVTLFLSPELNARLRPKLASQLKPGSRIVSHRYGIGDWVPEQTRTVMVSETRNHVFLWRVP